jgi:GT2 family glycosyltransferase
VKASWVVLTRGDRPDALARALGTIRASGPDEVVLVVNGGHLPVAHLDGVTVVELPENVGIPAGRDIGLRATTGDIVFFLDDDAELVDPSMPARVVDRFSSDAALVTVSFRLVDESGATARRHTPRPGRNRHARSGRVVGFLGGACAVRRVGYIAAGGYWGELFYGHEELELSWRLIDRGGVIEYLAEERVLHPHTPIGRHARGWWFTGRNRVWIARRTLPVPIGLVHVLVWLVLGTLRAPGSACRRQYLLGVWAGVRTRTERKPIRWRAVWSMTRMGRPPVI